jgi:hypothetical protein
MIDVKRRWKGNIEKMIGRRAETLEVGLSTAYWPEPSAQNICCSGDS